MTEQAKPVCSLVPWSSRFHFRILFFWGAILLVFFCFVFPFFLLFGITAEQDPFAQAPSSAVTPQDSDLHFCDRLKGASLCTVFAHERSDSM